jgi:L-ascorbate metabolism protein UlaG (beta-lactamase superfamily)
MIAERRGDRWSLCDGVLYPDPEVAPPAEIALERSNGAHLSAMVDAASWPVVHDWIASLSNEGLPDDPEQPLPIRDLLEALAQHGLVERCAGPPNDAPIDGDLTFVGHNSVLIDSGSTRVVADPFLFAEDDAYPRQYQPLAVRQLGPVDAVVITHSHPDHFDPASLLRFPSDVRVIVPMVERETILTTDMRLRLAELGFSNIHAMAWGDSTTVRDVEISALPFYGEQPTDGDVLHPEVSNHGNTYVVRTPTFGVALLADSGRDHRGDVRDVATSWARKAGPVDVVLSGYRGWATYPPLHLLSSVAPFFLFAPRTSWASRQQLMNSASDAVDVAERFGAATLVPYGDGGAPWHWRIGLGPRLDGSGVDDDNFDPFPARVAAAGRNRVHTPNGERLGSSVDVVLLHPGESLAGAGSAPRVVRHRGHEWPFAYGFEEPGDV